jgi:hypothetical protein
MSVRFDLSAMGSARMGTVPELPESSQGNEVNSRYSKGHNRLNSRDIYNEREKIKMEIVIPLHRRTGGQIISSLDKPVSPLMATLQDRLPTIKPDLISTLNEQIDGIWHNDRNVDEKIKSFLEKDIYSDPTMRKDVDAANKLLTIRTDNRGMPISRNVIGDAK